MTKTEKQNDSVINTKFKIISPKNNSKFKTKIAHLKEPSIAYLFLLKYPVNKIQKLNKIDSKEA